MGSFILKPEIFLEITKKNHGVNKGVILTTDKRIYSIEGTKLYREYINDTDSKEQVN
jgi:hypothetical protein